MGLKRKQIYNCCKYIRYLNIANRNFTIDNYNWLNNFNTSKIFDFDDIELSKNEKMLLKSIIDQIKINHAEEVKIYDVQIHKRGEKAIKQLSYVFKLLGGESYLEEIMR